MNAYKKVAVFCFAAVGALSMNAGTQTIKYSWNPDKTVLPSSQWTPDAPYEALVWIVNNGERWDGERYDEIYNHIWGTPADDAQGRKWYAADYTPTESEGIAWETRVAPFSSDGEYKGHASTQWVTGDVMGEIYMRRSFTLDAPVKGRLFLATGHDDGPSEWYINGELVYSISDGWNNDDRYELTDAQQALIKTDGSENIIAVHVHQNWGGAFADCGLYLADATYLNTYLNTLETGTWTCSYKLMENNDVMHGDLWWAAADLDESDWDVAEGPFSNSDDQWNITYWNSEANPMVVRRHFTLTAEDLAELADGKVKIRTSYDENPVFYLNGVRVCDFGGWNDNNYTDYYLNEEQKNLLKIGDNVLVVSVNQGGGGGHIDYGINYEATYIAPDEDIQPLIDALANMINQAKELFPNTTALNKFIADAEAVLTSTKNAGKISDATKLLESQYKEIRNAKGAIDCFYATKPLVNNADTTRADNEFDNAENVAQFNDALRDLRYARRLGVADKIEDVFEGTEVAEGEFYLYNLGQKKFLCGGSDWGAHAALGIPGILLTLEECNADDNQYHINTHLANGDNRNYMNYRGYMDCDRAGGWKFAPVEGKQNVYNILRGDYQDVHVEWNPWGSVDGGHADETNVCTEMRNLDPQNLNSQWKLVTAEERDEILAKATLKNPQDATYKIVSPNFNQREDAGSKWQITNGAIPGYGHENKNDFCLESWNTDECDFNQLISNLPNGVYSLTVSGFYRNGTHDNDWIDGTEVLGQPENDFISNVFIYAGDDPEDEVELPNINEGNYACPGEGREAYAENGTVYYWPYSIDDAACFFKSGIYKVRTSFTVENGEAMIGVYKEVKGDLGDWVVVDNFRLTYYGPDATEEEVDAINSGATMIEDVINEMPVNYDNRIFNLQGIQVKNPTAPGIYIQNGKKFIIK